MNAYKRVMKNSGAAGTDGMTCEQLMEHVKKKWAVIKVSLLEGTYEPNLVRRVEIPKPNGGVRQLGIPTAVDRLIQQALHQVLEPIFDPGFSEYSFKFRKNRGTRKTVQTQWLLGY
jgi:RNA-directed DNA polymerase